MNEEAHQTFATDGGNLWDIFGQIFVKLKMGKPWAAWAWWKKIEEGRGRRRRAVKQTCLPPAPRSPSVPSAACAGNVNVPPVQWLPAGAASYVLARPTPTRARSSFTTPSRLRQTRLGRRTHVNVESPSPRSSCTSCCRLTTFI